MNTIRNALNRPLTSFCIAITLLSTGCKEGILSDLSMQDTAGMSSNTSVIQLWTNAQGQALLDLRALQFNSTQLIKFKMDDGTACSCGIAATGSTTLGSLNITSCGYNGPVNNNPCAQFESLYAFSVKNRQLQLCDSNQSCESFH